MLRIACLFLLLIFTASAHAEPIPEFALDKDFENCMGGETAQKNPQRAAYCNCVKNEMRNWDLETYGALATEQSKAGNAQQIPKKIDDLAQGCIAKVLK